MIRNRRRGAAHDGDAAAPPAGAGRAHVAAAAAAPDPGADRPSLVQRAKALLDRLQRTRAARANARFGAKGGGLLTGGIAYATLFSVFAGLTIGYAVFMAVLGKNEHLRQSVITAISDALPGIIKTSAGDTQGLIDPSSLHLSGGLTAAGIVAFVVLVLSAISATAALQTAVRAMFTDEGGGNAAMGKVRQLGGFAAFAVAILLSAILTTAMASVTQWVLGRLDWSGGTTIALRLVGALVAFAVDAGMFVLVVRFLAGQRPPWRDQLWGAGIAAFGIGVVRWLGTSVVAGSAAKHNPALASFAVIVTLLVWVNLIARIVLLASAWTANPPLRVQPPAPPQEQARDVSREGDARAALS
ncbi:YihY/virulence factor BrkB family protein [Cellulomonas alba]|uniref:YihY/virulence factor BrkB family protein n=1 Tax=Cellulomonas alba TaxID=3053467 RepID=A0ABT7SHL5_9CELL|nr:YihY/virulence factor BrkB family protein [Cellulomonas alba]MDM7855684.1 YihY/virulence factor BrkB family protein [Cellulomonas alba]